MLAKLSPRNQVTLPQAVVSAMASNIDAAEYFDVAVEAGRIVLTPVHNPQAEEARAKVHALGIAETDVDAAIAWARQKSCA